MTPTGPTRGGAQLLRTLASADTILNLALPAARNIVLLPLDADGEPLGVVALERGGPLRSRVRARTLEMAGQFCGQAALVLRNALLHAEVERLATTDALTGLANRRVFEQALSRELARADREGTLTTLIIFDVDHFKQVNDTYGHQAGDEVLRHVGRALASVARRSEVVARFGGEEFVMVLGTCDEQEARAAAERVRAAIAAPGGPVEVTASAGAATGGPGVDGDELLRAADAALYRSKASGRDRTRTALVGWAPSPTRPDAAVRPASGRVIRQPRAASCGVEVTHHRDFSTVMDQLVHDV
jgi:diguanylate cyclase (GGDEF)-like protein